MGDKLKMWLKMNKDLPVRWEVNLNLAIASRLVNGKFEEVCSKFGISVPQYNVLRILMGVHPGGHSRCDVAARMIERSSDITRIIDRLEKQGLVARDRTQNDRRLSITRITNKGLKLMKDLEPMINNSHKEITSALTEDECKKLSDLTEKLYGVMM